MSDRPPKRTTSGEHAAVKAFREKLESIQEGTLEHLRDLNRKLEEELEGRPARKDPRREDDEEPPVDKVEFPTIPVPPEKKP